MAINVTEFAELRRERNGEYALVIKLDHLSTEFADELGKRSFEKYDLVNKAKEMVRNQYPDIKVAVVKVLVGGLVITSLPFATMLGANTASAAPVSSVSVSAVEQIPKIILDGNVLNTHAVNKNGTVYIPIRAVSESLGANVGWDHSSKTVTINQEGTDVRFAVGSNVAVVNGNNVNVPISYIDNGTTMVPLRFVSETLGLGVGWNNTTKTVTITSQQSEYEVVAGDTLWSIANRFDTSVDEIKRENNLNSDVLRVGQTLVIPKAGVQVEKPSTPAPPTEETVSATMYTVSSGDSLSGIAKKFGVSLDAIKASNNLKSDVIQVGQRLVIPTTGATEGVTVQFKNHIIRSGDNMWNISQQYGIPYLELLKVNNMTERSALTVGQVVKIPQYQVPVKEVVSAKHGELLDWWTEARYVFSTGKVATITDFQTGKTFKVKHTMGGNHADSEPLTARDAQIMKEVWGGSYSWTPRAIIVELDGRKLAASMHSFPHEAQTIRDNNYDGHFCIHFLNSQRHNDGLVQDSMQKQVQIAAGLTSS